MVEGKIAKAMSNVKLIAIISVTRTISTSTMDNITYIVTTYNHMYIPPAQGMCVMRKVQIVI